MTRVVEASVVLQEWDESKTVNFVNQRELLNYMKTQCYHKMNPQQPIPGLTCDLPDLNQNPLVEV